jgi:hypothetical protein
MKTLYKVNQLDKKYKIRTAHSGLGKSGGSSIGVKVFVHSPLSKEEKVNDND